MNTICAFSSDSRELYKADIYRVLSLPKGHTVHFRYKRKYVDDNFLETDARLNDKKVAIFFTHGNNLNTDNHTFKHFSIRWATIVKTNISNYTDVFHVYMKLENFCNLSIDSENPIEKQPSKKFFSTLNCTEGNNENNWQARISVIKEFFPKMTFFHVKGILNEYGHGRPLIYNNEQNSCHYNLTHGNRYILRLSVANPDSSDTKIEISDSSEEITINCINPLETSVQFDDHDIPISVKTLQVMKQSSLLEFKPTRKNNSGNEYIPLGEYSTNIELALNLNIKRPLVFGLFSTMAFWAILLANPTPSSANPPSTGILIFSTLLFFVSSSSLFFWFNKK